MWLIVGTAMLIFILIVIYEYRLRRPDQIVLAEVKGKVIQRKARFYPRHFSLAIPGTIYSLMVESEAEVKGKLLVHVKIAVSVAASPEYLVNLVRVGGWKKEAVVAAANELKVSLNSRIKEYCEKFEIEELSSERFSEYLNTHLGKSLPPLGLDIVSLSVQSIDPVDTEISEALRQQEAARIKEQTEEANQRARLSAVRARLKTDEQVAHSEHRLVIQKYELKKVEQEKESELARERVAEELKRRQMQIEVDGQEMELLKNHPELLMLTPQIARLAEASQNLKNARTIVSLSPGDTGQGGQILGLLQNLLQSMLQKASVTANNSEKVEQ